MSTDTQILVPDADALIQEFLGATKGKLDDHAIESTVSHFKQLGAAASPYPAKGGLTSLVFYIQCKCSLTEPNGNQWNFSGDAGGFASPGGGALFGYVYPTDNLSELVQNTVSFMLIPAPAYTSFVFFDSHSKNLGSFQSVNASTIVGTPFGGSGKWERK